MKIEESNIQTKIDSEEITVGGWGLNQQKKVSVYNSILEIPIEFEEQQLVVEKKNVTVLSTPATFYGPYFSLYQSSRDLLIKV